MSLGSLPMPLKVIKKEDSLDGTDSCYFTRLVAPGRCDSLDSWNTCSTEASDGTDQECQEWDGQGPGGQNTPRSISSGVQVLGQIRHLEPAWVPQPVDADCQDLEILMPLDLAEPAKLPQARKVRSKAALMMKSKSAPATGESENVNTHQAQQQVNRGKSSKKAKEQHVVVASSQQQQSSSDYSHKLVPKTLDLEVLSKLSNSGEEPSVPTTWMVRNVPNVYTQADLVDELEDLGFGGAFDFLYLPVDKSSLASVGYAFVNFISSAWATRFSEKMEQGHTFTKRGKSKVASASVAHMQGLAANLAHYERCAVKSAKVARHRPLVVLGREELPLLC